MAETDLYPDDNLKRLSDLDNYTVEPGDPDPRGWTVFMAGGNQVGTVIDLLVDDRAMEVRYLVVDVDARALPGVPDSGQTALIRAEDVDLEGGSRRVTAREFANEDIHRTRRMHTTQGSQHGQTQHGDTAGTGSSGRTGDTRLTRSEEEPRAKSYGARENLAARARR